MIRLLDGPAQGTYAVHRAPHFLRATEEHGTFDVLDQLNDVACASETIHVYEMTPDSPHGHVHLNRGSAKRGSGFYALGEYRHRPEVDGESVRATVDWRDWCDAEAQRQLVAAEADI